MPPPLHYRQKASLTKKQSIGRSEPGRRQGQAEGKKINMQTKLPINGTIQHPDLAEALRGESGTFFCQQGGQGYIVTAAEGFSIKSLRPVGRKIVEANVLMTAAPEPWAITKISEDVLEFSSIPQQSPRQQRAA